MSSLNKAFLKAYQKIDANAARQRAAAAPIATPISKSTESGAPVATQTPPAPHFMPQSGGVVQEAAVQAVAALSAMTNAAKAMVVEGSAASQVAPSPVAPGSSPGEPSTAQPTQPAIPFAMIDSAHASVKAPHAKFVPPSVAPHVAPSAPKTSPAEAPILARPQSTPFHSSSSVSNVWQPVFELSNFIWPEITEAILAAAPGQLQTAATDLAEACRRHRKLVAVTGVRGGEGCSVIAMTLARALAAQQQKVVLVDAHFAAPRLANCLGVAAEVGWEESLAGERPLAEAVVQSIADQMALLPLKQPTPADWRLAETRLKSCFDELRRHFDVVLIDAGPLGEPSDKRHLLAWAAPCRVDRALVVLDGRSAIEQDMADVDNRLQACGIAQWSFVDNFAAA
ncbi:MAG TPA: cellulose synthase operon protein YhjQ/BcsQ [Pirellulales bacterium]